MMVDKEPPGRPWTKYNREHFWGDLLSDLGPAILFLLRLFAICEIALLYYCLLGVW